MGGITKCCCSEASCPDLAEYIPPKICFNEISKVPADWLQSSSDDFTGGSICCPYVVWDSTDLGIVLLKRVWNFSNECPNLFTPQLWCTSAYLDQIVFMFSKFACETNWYVRMQAKVYLSMTVKAPAFFGAPDPVIPECGALEGSCNSYSGFVYLERDLLVTDVNPSQQIVFTSADHYEETCYENNCVAYRTEEISTTVYGGCYGESGATCSGPHNATTFDLTDIDFAFDIISGALPCPAIP